MNACGRDLTCADMVGNFILMPLDRERQERLYADHLYPIECGFERDGGEDHFEAFIRHYLTLRTGEIPKRGEEYAVFRTHARSRRVADAAGEALQELGMRDFAEVVGQIALDHLVVPRARVARFPAGGSLPRYSAVRPPRCPFRGLLDVHSRCGRGREAGYPAPPAQIPACPVGHGAPTSGV